MLIVPESGGQTGMMNVSQAKHLLFSKYQNTCRSTILLIRRLLSLLLRGMHHNRSVGGKLYILSRIFNFCTHFFPLGTMCLCLESAKASSSVPPPPPVLSPVPLFRNYACFPSLSYWLCYKHSRVSGLWLFPKGANSLLIQRFKISTWIGTELFSLFEVVISTSGKLKLHGWRLPPYIVGNVFSLHCTQLQRAMGEGVEIG